MTVGAYLGKTRSDVITTAARQITQSAFRNVQSLKSAPVAATLRLQSRFMIVLMQLERVLTGIALAWRKRGADVANA